MLVEAAIITVLFVGAAASMVRQAHQPQAQQLLVEAVGYDRLLVSTPSRCLTRLLWA
ncbi:MAG: hypothetical protein LBS86_03515 [Treponema sp.]|nr:hypothetical protein [Treponema sp.]